MTFSHKYDSLDENKRNIEAAYEQKIATLIEEFNHENEENRNTFSQKMLEDAAKYQELQQKKEEEAR